jgi:hypothetical protein
LAPGRPLALGQSRRSAPLPSSIQQPLVVVLITISGKS